jgi:O-acetylserine/cysteine efflux transporter
MDASAAGASMFRPNGLEKKNAMSAIQIVCAVAVPLLWGYQFVAIKVGVMEFPPLFFLALRFLGIALLLIPFVKTPTRQQFGPVAAISVFLGGLNFGLFYVGLGLGSGSMSAVAYQLATPFTVLLAWPLLAERPSLTTYAGVLFAFVGVVVLAAGPGLSANALPLLLVVGAAFAFAVSNVLTKRYGPFDPLMLMGWSSLLTVPQVMLMSLLLEHRQLASLVTADERGWLALAYTIFIGGIVGFGLWFWLIARCSMGRVAPFGLLLPVFAVISSVLFLGDHITSRLIVGGLLTISGVAITQVRSSARPTRT